MRLGVVLRDNLNIPSIDVIAKVGVSRSFVNEVYSYREYLLFGKI